MDEYKNEALYQILAQLQEQRAEAIETTYKANETIAKIKTELGKREQKKAQEQKKEKEGKKKK